MKLTITTTPKAVEVVNYLLSNVIVAVEKNDTLCKKMKLNAADIKRAEKFRERLIKELLNQ